MTVTNLSFTSGLRIKVKKKFHENEGTATHEYNVAIRSIAVLCKYVSDVRTEQSI